MAVYECMRCVWEQRSEALGVTQRERFSPRVPSHLRFQHGHEIGAESKYQILRETRQIYSGDFLNDTTCIWK